MSGGGGRKPAGMSGEEAEVEALLRAAQDAVLLKLQANSHLVSSSSSSNPPSFDPDTETDPLDADLARRFDALRSSPLAPKQANASPAGGGGGGMGELEARFAALKGTAGPEETRVRLEDLGGESEEDEVEKVMRWAKDAARLDVATAGGKTKHTAGGKTKHTEDDEHEDDDGKSSVSEVEEDGEERSKLEMARKSKSKSKNKWFFF